MSDGTTPCAANALRSAAVALTDGEVSVVGPPGAPRLSGIWFGFRLYGSKLGCCVNAPYIGSAARSSWFIAWMPRICSIVLTMLSCV